MILHNTSLLTYGGYDGQNTLQSTIQVYCNDILSSKKNAKQRISADKSIESVKRGSTKDEELEESTDPAQASTWNVWSLAKSMKGVLGFSTEAVDTVQAPDSVENSDLDGHAGGEQVHSLTTWTGLIWL